MPIYKITSEDRAKILASDRCRAIGIVDNAHVDHGTHHTMALSKNVAQLLRDELGVEAEYVHAVEHAV
ncbi:hypothetical protein [Bradyrhizobium sp. RT3a]|uniref:hypothetical protein n=1 Tax=unclassified Bradyrhizobium TaxID=2631580 RepID=UPI003390E2F7